MSTGIATVWNNDEVLKQVITLCSEVLCEGFARQGACLDEISAMIPSKTLKRINQVSD